jgi:general stress protein 26
MNMEPSMTVLTGQEAHTRLHELIDTIETAMLVTNDKGTLRSRPMHTLARHDDLYFMTGRNTETSYEIGKNAQLRLDP